MRWLVAGLLHLLALPAAAQDFDYFVLSLSWSPSWCATAGEAGAEQCASGRDLGFTLHGLWPQNEDGSWPEYCETDVADPGRRETGTMADIMGSGGLAWYQWKKHGRCSGLSARAYFGAARAAFEALALPEPANPATAAEIEAALLAVNRGIAPDGVIVTCAGGQLDEVRLCLDRDLLPRSCDAEMLRDACRGRGALDVPPAD